ncbi:MAG: hypothetical protein PSY14_10640 [bacterium]|nr:hypothetical protein [bacterium]
MFVSDDVDGNLARDYLRGADGFMLAAEKILNSTDSESADWLFKLESPVTFLICHSAELILKAGLVRTSDFEKIKFTHDLLLLLEKSQKAHIPLNEKFSTCVTITNNNFSNHDHRYQRSFSGFPSADHDRLVELMKREPRSKEFRQYGLVPRTGVDLLLFLEASKDQSNMTIKWVDSKET